jgi:hypothetical protein
LWQTVLALLAKPGVENLVTDALMADKSVVEVDSLVVRMLRRSTSSWCWKGTLKGCPKS